MQLPRKKIWFFIARNLALYVCMLLLTFYFSSEERKLRHAHVLIAVVTNFYFWSVFHNLVLFERIFLRRKYLLYFLSLFPFFFILTFIEKMLMQSLPEGKSHWAPSVIGNIEFTLMGLLFYISYKYMMERKTFFQTKMMQRDIELQQLKAHLNPHFLFNALNNIYSYTLQHNRYGNELILKLSELMRFILDCAEKSQITVGEELAFIRDYIVFEKERLGERCEINCEIEEGDPQKKVAPLILFPFIENACKYGSDTIQNTQIDIVIQNNEEQLRLMVMNSIVNRNPPSTKTGLQNTIRRLELLYPDQHEVLITTDDNRFTVELILRYENKDINSRR